MRRALALSALLLESACGLVDRIAPPEDAAAATPVRAPGPAGKTAAEELVAYLARLRNMNDTALNAEAARQKRDASDLARVKAALALSLSLQADEAEILALVDATARKEDADRDVKAMAGFLQAMAAERRRLKETAASANAKLRDVVRRVVNDRKLPIVAKGIRIELNCEHVTAYCDEEKIRVVLDNLLSNAIKYSPDRGLISIKLYKEHGDAVFEVLDEGPGIPPSEREKIFEAFYRGTDLPVASVKGSGLGLSIVKEYVQLHKGRIEVLEGPGAHFRIRFPRKKSDAEEEAA